MPALAELEAFKDEGVRETVARRFAASTLLPAVSAVDEYHRGMLFCVQSIAERSAHGMRLELLQAVWRWRDLGASMGAEKLSEDVGELRARLGEHAELGPYTLLLAAIVAGNDKRHAQSRAWAERGLAQANEHEVAVRVALTVVWAEALVGLGETQEALNVLEAIESEMPGHRLTPFRNAPVDPLDFLQGKVLEAMLDYRPRRNRARALDFLPEAEVLMTKAFVLSKLGRHGEAIEAGEAAEWRLRSGRVWGRIDEERFTRLMGARVAPLLQHSHEAESRRYGRRSTRYFRDHSPRGLQEEYGHALKVKAEVEEALSSGDYEEYLDAQREAERLLLEAMVQPGEVRFADAGRNSAYEELVSLKREVAELENERRRATGDSVRATGAGDEELSGQLRAKKAELARFVRALQRRHPDIAARWAKAPTDLAQLQGRLDAKTGIVQYLVLDGESYAFVIHRDGLEIERLGYEGRDVGLGCAEGEVECFGLARSVPRYRALLHGAGAGGKGRAEELAELGERLSQVLLGPVMEHVGGLEHWVVVPNNVLHQLPWAALPWGGGYLVEHKVLSVLPASSLFGAVLGSSREGPAGLLALGNPTPAGSQEWRELRAAQAEVERLEGYFPELSPKTILTGARASLDAVVGRALGGYVLHFAAHARSGMESGPPRLLLSGGDLTYDRILALDIAGAPSVVLSACETGVGELLSGDQVYSLADAFLLAEARSVVYSLWLVDDESTGELMGEFYARHGGAGGNAQALAGAQRAMIRRGYPPGHWAGFVVSEWEGRAS